MALMCIILNVWCCKNWKASNWLSLDARHLGNLSKYAHKWYIAARNWSHSLRYIIIADETGLAAVSLS